MRATIAVAVVALALVIVSCGTSDRHKHATGSAKQVGDTVSALQRDLITRNWADICNALFSSQARAQAGGAADCPDFVARGAAGLRRERIRVRKIEVQAPNATADVLTTADGQAPVPATIQLVLEGGRYKISALAR
jgi:hypothetical protein